MAKKYPPELLILALIIDRHEKRNETVTFRSLLDELFPLNGRDLMNNITFLEEFGMIYITPEKIPPSNKYVHTYHLSDHDRHLLLTLTPTLHSLYPSHPFFTNGQYTNQ